MLPLFSIVIPFACIAVSIFLSPWFNLLNNALSDLGHSTRSPVAPIFNFGLSLGGFLVSFAFVLIISKVSRTLACLGALCGYTLVLVAVFDEVYGSLHYWVSLAFFLVLSLLLGNYIIVAKIFLKKALAAVALTIAISSWVLHLAYRIPKGAAIPEIVSILCVVPFYIDIVLHYTVPRQ